MIPLHRIATKWPGSEIELELEFAGGKEGESVSLPSVNVIQASEELSLMKGKTPPISFQRDENYIFYPIHLRENTEYICAVTLKGTIDELINAGVNSGFKAWPFLSPRMKQAFRLNPKRYWKSEKRGKQTFTTITGRLNFSSQIGIADLSISDKEQFRVEVASEKISYFEDFKFLLDDLSKEIIDLMIQVGAATGLNFSRDDKAEPEDYVKIFHLRWLFSPSVLHSALGAILKSPHSRLLSEMKLVELNNIRAPDFLNIAADAASLHFQVGGPLSGLFLGYTPSQLIETHKFETYDTQENRYIKNFLEEILAVCQRLAHSLQKRCIQRSETCFVWESSLAEVNHWIDNLLDWLNYPLWREVGKMKYLPSNSQVLQKRDGYRDILQADFRLQLGLKLPWHPGTFHDTVGGDIRPIFDLYEFWCLFKLRSVLRKLIGHEIQETTDLWKISDDGLVLYLKRGLSSRLSFKGNISGVRIKVDFFYNKRFNHTEKNADGSYSIGFQPDFTLGISPDYGHLDSENQELYTYIHFDAKYRLDYFEEADAEDNNNFEETADKSRSKRADLTKMHAYKDAIRRSSGAYVIYPGTEEKRFINYQEILPGIGAFPLRPSTLETDLNNIYAFIGDLLNHLASKFSQHYRNRYWTEKSYGKDEIREVYLPPKDDEVLIGTVKTEVQWEWTKKNNIFYVSLLPPEKAKSVPMSPLGLKCDRILMIISKEVHKNTSSNDLFWAKVKKVQVLGTEEMLNLGASIENKLCTFFIFKFCDLEPCPTFHLKDIVVKHIFSPKKITLHDLCQASDLRSLYSFIYE